LSSKDKENAQLKLKILIRERSEKILKKFGQIAVSGITQPKVLAALEDIKKYWRDFNRPSLTFFSCEAVGGTPEAAETAALMFTLASSGFGIHDDVLDKSKNKHLRRTIFGLYGVDTALLIGDLLIVKAWTLAHEMIRNTGDPTKIADVLETYGYLSVEICEAEFMETQCRRRVDTDLDFYESILWKEMAETEVCCRIGGMMGEGKSKEIEALSEYGRRLGFISRLADEIEDCLNVKGDLHHRLKYESVPLPLLYAAKSSNENFARIKEIVDKDNINTLDVTVLLDCCFETEAFKYVHSLAEKNGEKAKLTLDSVRPSTARNVLLSLINRAYTRVDRLCI
jgi:geranylgeranyl pyrophosphate synthase